MPGFDARKEPRILAEARLVALARDREVGGADEQRPHCCMLRIESPIVSYELGFSSVGLTRRPFRHH